MLTTRSSLIPQRCKKFGFVWVFWKTFTDADILRYPKTDPLLVADARNPPPVVVSHGPIVLFLLALYIMNQLVEKIAIMDRNQFFVVVISIFLCNTASPRFQISMFPLYFVCKKRIHYDSM